jgi:hypothetical protein
MTRIMFVLDRSFKAMLRLTTDARRERNFFAGQQVRCNRRGSGGPARLGFARAQLILRPDPFYGLSKYRFKCQTAMRTHLRVLAAQCVRALRQLPPSRKQEGAGKAGCALHPRSRVQNCVKKRTRAYRFSGNTPAFPARWFTAYSVLSPVTGLSCHRRRRDTSRRLDASVGASGPHGFAVRDRSVRHVLPSRPPHPTARS